MENHVKRKVNIDDLLVKLPYIFNLENKREMIQHIGRLQEIDFLMGHDNLTKALLVYHGFLKENTFWQTNYDVQIKMLYELVGTKGYEFQSNKNSDGRYNAEAIYTCGSKIKFDDYEKQGYAEIIKMNHCGFFMCPQCQENRSILFIRRYMPVLESQTNNSDIYVGALTQGNTDASGLRSAHEKMKISFIELLKILSGERVITGFDLSYLGYKGALRNIECTVKIENRPFGKEYHPHIHFILSLAKNLDMEEIYTNEYSYSASNGIKQFSELELIIQALWKLLIDGERITAKKLNDNVNFLRQYKGKDTDNPISNYGYSCMLRKVERDEDTGKLLGAYEVFKYSTKAFNGGKNAEMLDFDQFDTFKKVYSGERMLEGYGIFRNKKDTEEFAEVEEPEESEEDKMRLAFYEDFKTELQSNEMPKVCVGSTANVFEDMLSDRPRRRYFSKKIIYTFDMEFMNGLKSMKNFNEMMAKVETRQIAIKNLREMNKEIARLKFSASQYKYEPEYGISEFASEKEKIAYAKKVRSKRYKENMRVQRSHERKFNASMKFELSQQIKQFEKAIVTYGNEHPDAWREFKREVGHKPYMPKLPATEPAITTQHDGLPF